MPVSAQSERLAELDVADVAALPFTDDSVDLVVSTISMHHWDLPEAGLCQRRVAFAEQAKPGSTTSAGWCGVQNRSATALG